MFERKTLESIRADFVHFDIFYGMLEDLSVSSTILRRIEGLR